MLGLKSYYEEGRRLKYLHSQQLDPLPNPLQTRNCKWGGMVALGLLSSLSHLCFARERWPD